MVKAHKCHRVHRAPVVHSSRCESGFEESRQQWVTCHKREIKELSKTENEKNRQFGKDNSGVATAVSNTKSETSSGRSSYVERDLGAEANSERACYDTNNEIESNASSYGGKIFSIEMCFFVFVFC